MGNTSKKVRVSNELKQKSIDSFLLCIEIYNKPTINYRVEASAFFICNAWELLLKGHYILKNGIKSIYRKTDNKTFSLEEMLKKYYNDNSSIKKNLDYIIENIRNKATHYIIKNHDILYTPLLQKAVLNYADELKEKFNVDIADIIPLESLAFIVKREKAPINLAKLFGKSFVDIINEDEDRLSSFIQSNTLTKDNTCDVIAVVETKFAFVKNPKIADINAYYDNTGVGLREVIVSKDIEFSHPFIMKQVIKKVKEILPEYNLKGLNSSSLYRYNMKIGVSNKPEFYKEVSYSKNCIKKYSQAYIDKVIQDIKNDPTLFSK